MARKTSTTAAGTSGGRTERASARGDLFPLDDSGDLMLFIGEPPAGSEPVAGVIAFGEADVTELADRWRLGSRAQEVSKRLGMDVEDLLDALADTKGCGTGRPNSQLSAEEEATLREIGLLRPPPAEGADNPSTVAALRYGQLLAGSLSAKEAAQRLHVSEGRIRQRLGERTLYGITYKRAWRLPGFQFTAGDTLPGIERVLPRLDPALHALAVEGFFTRRQPDLVMEGTSVSPRDWLTAGSDPSPVADLAGDLVYGV